MGITFVDRAALTADARAELEARVSDHNTLERVVRWGIMQNHVVSKVIKQDEYTQDVVLPIGEALFLVYDCT
jgi:hypothetical protein